MDEDASVTDAEEGESYEVKFIDEYQILWYRVTTNNSFAERTSHKHLEGPVKGEIWEVCYHHPITDDRNLSRIIWIYDQGTLGSVIK